MNFCPICGAKYIDGKFCLSCGVDLSKYLSVSIAEPFFSNTSSNLQNSISELDEAFKIAVNQKKREENERIEREKQEQERLGIKHQEKLANRFIILGSIFRRYNGDEEVVIIPEGVEYIGRYAFEDCKTVKKVICPKSLKEIEDAAFNNCINLEIVEINYGVKILGRAVFYKCGKLKKINLPLSIEKIGDSCFAYCSSLENIELPDTIKEIDHNMFLNCLSLYKVKLPAKLEFIRYRAFYCCISLVNIEIPSSVKKIERDCFYNTHLREIFIPRDCDYVPKELYSGDSFPFNCTVKFK